MVERRREREDLPTRRALARDRVDLAVWTERRGGELVGEAREPEPVFSFEHVMLDLAAVTVGDEREDPLAVVAPPQLHLGDPREVFPERVGVGRVRRTELVEPDLLVEIEIHRRTFAAARITRVVEAAAVRAPRHAAPGGAALNARDRVALLLAGRDVEDVEIAALGAVLRERDGDELSIR
jgi:hypothetical protein